MIDIIESAIIEREPKAKDLSYKSDEDKNVIVKFRIGNKKHQITINNAMYQLSIAGPDKKLGELREEYNAMRDRFDKRIKVITFDVKEEFKPEFDKIEKRSEELKQEADDLTKEFLIAKVDNYFNDFNNANNVKNVKNV